MVNHDKYLPFESDWGSNKWQLHTSIRAPSESDNECLKADICAPEPVSFQMQMHYSIIVLKKNYNTIQYKGILQKQVNGFLLFVPIKNLYQAFFLCRMFLFLLCYLTYFEVLFSLLSPLCNCVLFLQNLFLKHLIINQETKTNSCSNLTLKRKLLMTNQYM